MRFFLLILFAAFAFSCKTETPANRNNVNNNSANGANKTINQTTEILPVYTYEIVNTFKHDSNAFTEGLFFHDGFLYESTGQKSDLRKSELESGKIVQQVKLPSESFGEGTTILSGKIYQLTWQEGKAFVYDAENLKLLKELSYEGQGWGLTTDGTNLIMSDGTYNLKVIDPETFKTVRKINVFQTDGKPLFLINELEYIKGEVWANIWHSEEKETGVDGYGRLPNINKPNYIVRIDPNSGKLLGWIDLGGISPDDAKRDQENTLNGIAYDAAADRIFVTGKNWKNLFEIRIKPKQ